MAWNLRRDIVRNRKIMPLKEYKQWLEDKLVEHGVDRNNLYAVVITVERTLNTEMLKMGAKRRPPFYKLFKDDGNKTRAWIYAAELALFLKYQKFKASPYVQSIVTHPFVKKKIMSPSKKQIPLSILFPATRLNSDRLKDYSRHFRSWLDKHG